MNGSMNERNCATRIRYSSRIGEKQADREAAEGHAHALHHSAQGDFDTLRNVRLRDQPVDVVRDGAEVFAERAYEDIDHSANLKVIDLGGALDTLNVADHVQARGLDGGGPAQRDRAQVDQVLDLLFADIERPGSRDFRCADRSTGWGRSSDWRSGR